MRKDIKCFPEIVYMKKTKTRDDRISQRRCILMLWLCSWQLWEDKSHDGLSWGRAGPPCASPWLPTWTEAKQKRSVLELKHHVMKVKSCDPGLKKDSRILEIDIWDIRSIISLRKHWKGLLLILMQNKYFCTLSNFSHIKSQKSG